jgi:hypothetical protein
MLVLVPGENYHHSHEKGIWESQIVAEPFSPELNPILDKHTHDGLLFVAAKTGVNKESCSNGYLLPVGIIGFPCWCSFASTPCECKDI